MLKARLRALSDRALSMLRGLKHSSGAVVTRAVAKARALQRSTGAAANTGLRASARALAAIRSEHLRERLWAVGAFAGLALMLAASLDFLLGGGPNWNSNAEAAPYRADAYLTLSALPEIPYAPPAEIVAMSEEQTRVTPVGYVAPAGVLLGGPLPGDELEAPGAIVYAHEGPAPFGEY